MGFQLLPPGPGKCQECAVRHAPGEPHNRDSLHYQYWFRGKHGRWPTWRDAIAHMEPEGREDVEAFIRAEGKWEGWEGDVPPVPDVLPSPDGSIGSVTVVPIEPEPTKRKRRRK